MSGAASPTDARVHDVVGVGIGPFNLGLAALAAPLDLDTVFLDTAPEFRWHPGMMLEGATTQVPFLADLVTMADPTSPYSFLAWLKATGRLYAFYIRESFYPLRAEYDAYCRWVAAQLPALRWGRTVTSVEVDPHDDDLYVVHARTTDGGVESYRTRHVVLGVGTQPVVPAALRGLGGPVVHSSDYLPQRDRLRAAASVTVVGSGQSAAEVYRDLLESTGPGGPRLDWVTRSPRFFPMEYTKLTLEMTSPEYTDHFHALPVDVRDRLAREQRGLSKGISAGLVDDIYDALYRRSAAGPVPTTLLTDTEVLGASWDGARYTLRLRHAQLGTEHERTTEALVLATGYAAQVPDVVLGIAHRLAWDERGRLDVARDYSVDGGRGRVFVQNGEEHTHGLTAPDLGFGPWRSSAILAAVCGREVYPRERRIAFQEFGVPTGHEPPPAGTVPAPAAPAATLAAPAAALADEGGR
ncbi:lysine N(6)-hydroxylase/L-ornithine N(5)-oxygenase family protein [Cellulomonas shaoxiangyii]|uniref:L-lysine N6-monooxygenase MbtG n=1 Tax=Cellulomonas shaoxiangyii TaxID=2566013 RepID=A0A4V1CN14_9CELL|nr:SidA/IucD/PvdA family monooxygenase [Cellulomonas shaoxiangyii]QCB94855.1 L-lysine 6-monooxygenase [Cellulomonas shaoxiangyii]TGY82023.1 L-lysine 6-monooxygenase [Cellulomonas shaoxiangyii]